MRGRESRESEKTRVRDKEIPVCHTHALNQSFVTSGMLISPDICTEHSSEDSLESLASNLPTKEFVIPQGA